MVPASFFKEFECTVLLSRFHKNLFEREEKVASLFSGFLFSLPNELKMMKFSCDNEKIFLSKELQKEKM